MSQRCVLLVNDAELAEGFGATRDTAYDDAVEQLSGMELAIWNDAQETGNYEVEYFAEEEH